MTPVSSLKRAAALAILVAAVAGCANKFNPMAGHSHGMANSAAGHSHNMDPQQMCEHHRQMASAPGHQAMMQEHMKGMPAEQMQKHMQEMQEKCK